MNSALVHSVPTPVTVRLASTVPSNFSRLTRSRGVQPGVAFAHSEPLYVVDGLTATP